MKKIFFILALFSVTHQLFGMDGESASKKNKSDQERPLTAIELTALGDSHKKHGDWQKAIESYEAALPISKTLKELYGVNAALAYTYGPDNPNPSRSGYRKASFFFENTLTLLGHFKAEDASQQAKLTSIRDGLLYKVADSCFLADRNAEAITYGQQALDLTKDPVQRAYLCHIIGACYRPTDITTSEKFLRRGLEEIATGKPESDYQTLKTQIKGSLCKELAHTLFIGSTHNRQCNLTKLGEAKTLYNEALKSEEKVKYRAPIWIQLGLICKKTKETALARGYFEVASEESVKAQNPQAYACAKMLLAQMK